MIITDEGLSFIDTLYPKLTKGESKMPEGPFWVYETKTKTTPPMPLFPVIVFKTPEEVAPWKNTQYLTDKSTEDVCKYISYCVPREMNWNYMYYPAPPPFNCLDFGNTQINAAQVGQWFVPGRLVWNNVDPTIAETLWRAGVSVTHPYVDKYLRSEYKLIERGVVSNPVTGEDVVTDF